MARWEPNAGNRLEEAALELFAQHGFDQTTVEDIASRAGVTRRTFFRHYPDKREVLFGGGDAFLRFCVDSLDGAPPSTTPVAAIALALDVVAAAFQPRAERAHRRSRIIAASAELRERELVKLAAVSAALAERLRARGVPEPAASVAAETGVAVFRTAFDRWALAGEDGPELTVVLRESFAALGLPGLDG